MNTRRAELTRELNDLTYQKLKLQREIRKVAAFSTAIADGGVTPNELAQLSSHYIGEAINLNEASFMYADEGSDYMTNYYLDQYSGLTEDVYYQNSSLMQQANLFWNPDTGTLDEEAIKADLMEQFMKEYVEKYIEPELKAYEDELEEQKLNLETQATAVEAELKGLDDKISQSIQNDAIKV